MNIRFLDPARDEFSASVQFYEAQAKGLGNEFIVEVEHITAIAAQNPKIGVSVGDDIRWLLFRRFPCQLIYLTEPNNLIVIALAHQHRRPGYGRTRY